MITLNSKRLVLNPLSLEQLETALVSIRMLAASMGVPIVSRLLDGAAERAVTMKIEKMRSTPREKHPWFTYWLIVLKEEKIGAGLVGFKGTPNANGEIEIGYGMDEQYQRCGYMTEAVNALNEWAFSHAAVHAITATHVLAKNYASQKVLIKTGFVEEFSDAEFINFVLRSKNR